MQEALLAFINPENAKDVYGRPSPNTHLDAGFSEQRAKLSRIVNAGGVRHLTISVSKREYDEWEDFSNTQMVNAFDDHLAKYCKRIIASEFIYHPHRIRPEILRQLKSFVSTKSNKADKLKRKREKKKGLKKVVHTISSEFKETESYTNEILDKFYDENERSGFWDAIHNNVLNLSSKLEYVYFSPHFHLVYCGSMPKANEYYKATGGWVYKNINKGKPIPLKIDIKDGEVLKDNLRAIIAYLTTHTAIFTSKSGKANDVVHYRGLFSPKKTVLLKTEEGKKIVQRIYEAYIDCDICGPGNHLILCDKNETPILGRNGAIHAKDKLVVYKSELTPLGKQMVEKLLNLNWPVSRIQMDVSGEKTLTNTPDPPPEGAKQRDKIR